MQMNDSRWIQARELRQLVDNASQETLGFSFLRYNFFGTGGWFTARITRLFKKHPKIRFRNRVVESVFYSIKDMGGIIQSSDIFFNHFGHCKPFDTRQKKIEGYLDLLNQQLTEDPDEIMLYADIALNLRALGQFSEALNKIEHVVNHYPEWSRLYLIYGDILCSSGRVEEALTQYLYALKLRPDDARIWNMVGVLNLILADIDEAENAFDQAMKKDRALLPAILVNQGLAAQAKGDFEAALFLFKKASVVNPAFLYEDWNRRLEFDPYRPLQYETIPQYAGLSYHQGFCEYMIKRKVPKI